MAGRPAHFAVFVFAAAAVALDCPWAPGAEVWPVFPGDVPGNRPGTVGPEFNMTRSDGLILWNVSVPTLEPFVLPSTGQGSGTAVVIAPGGGYEILAFTKEGTDIAKWFNDRGVSAFVLKYRVPGRTWLPFGEAALTDAQRAMGLVRQHAGALGLNASRIGFLGFSAGGNLVGQISTKYQQRLYQRIDVADDVSCKPDFSVFVYPWRLLKDDLRTVDLPVDSQHPPALLVQSEDDNTAHVETSLFYYAALKVAGAPGSEMHLYSKGGHGYGRCTTADVPVQFEACSWPQRAEDFMRSLGVWPTASSDLLF